MKIENLNHQNYVTASSEKSENQTRARIHRSNSSEEDLFDLELKIEPKLIQQMIQQEGLTQYCGSDDNCTGCGCNTCCSSC